ncbi:MAG: MMPL family transporter [Micromonosporaceae bacterium]|nr:MMPL family transporter [Micromonosporaceae bacterium]
MLASWGRAVVRYRWTALGAALVLAVVGLTWGTGVFGALTGGGFDDPDSESTRAHTRITQELGDQDVDLLVLYSSAEYTVDDPEFRQPVTATLDALRQRPEVAGVASYYGAQDPALVSTDRHATYAVVRLRADGPDGKVDAYEKLEQALHAPGVTTQVGGNIAFLSQANEQSKKDIERAELISMPILLVLLVIIFGGLVAAATPLLIGGLAILGGFVVTRLIAMATDVSIFAINVITLIGLGLAIDYSLFIVSRFREELAAGHDRAPAIARTMATAGRTVLASGLIIILALGSLLIFPQAFLRSMGFGGMAAVFVAMLASLTVLPALLAVLGPRINAWPIPVPWRRRDRGGWARLARSVMRRPIPYAVGVVAVLALLAVPFTQVRWGGFDERALPADASARVVNERIAADFTGGMVAPIGVLVSGASVEQAQQFADQIARLPQVTGARIVASRGQSSLVQVTYPGEPTGDEAAAAVRAIRELPAPPGSEVLVGGRTAADLDLLHSLGTRLPWMALIMASATLVLLFLAFGSVVLPVKAVLMNVVSIGASFGAVVWGFQEGHLAGLLDFTPTGFIEPTNLILMLAVLFGLSTDYEVFLLSRVREEWDRTGDNTASVAAGLQRTGRIITAAALLLMVVVAGFTAGGIAFIKLIGTGQIVALVVDAALVRALLVPATMRLLGRWNWWAPGRLGRVYRRYGIREEPAPAREMAEAR